MEAAYKNNPGSPTGQPDKTAKSHPGAQNGVLQQFPWPWDNSSVDQVEDDEDEGVRLFIIRGSDSQPLPAWLAPQVECTAADKKSASNNTAGTSSGPEEKQKKEPVATHRVKRMVPADRSAAEAFMNERYQVWQWVTDWEEETPIAFADACVDEDNLVTVYFNTMTGQPTSVEAVIAGETSDYDWPGEDNESEDTASFNRLQLLAKEFVDEHRRELYDLLNEAAVQNKDVELPIDNLPEDRSCWNEICERLNNIAMLNSIPVTVFPSGDRLFISANIGDKFTAQEMDDFAQSLNEE